MTTSQMLKGKDKTNTKTEIEGTNKQEMITQRIQRN